MSIETPETEPTSEISRARIRRETARILMKDSRTCSEVVTELQSRWDVPETIIREQMQDCLDAGLLYGELDDNAEVRLP